MAQIEIMLEKQLLTIQNREVIASGDVNYDSCRFEFDESWEGYIKTAVFYQEKQKVYYAVLDNENKCYIPAPAIVKASPLYIGVFGVRGNKILTSAMDSISIVEGAVSGEEVDIEPSETVFAAIIAHYQVILDAIVEQNQKFDEAYRALEDQNEFLRKLNAFEIEPLEFRMSAMEITLDTYGEVIRAEKKEVDDLLLQIRAQSFVIRDVEMTFDENGEFRLENELVDENCLCTAYFDAISIEESIGHAIYVESHNGYILFVSTSSFGGTLNCTIEVRRGENYGREN
ncbi:MAG: hypothetical protein OSJ72_16940 [Lachnospiraceae bacterium]|nr:hypothetical protein [Lachnospiraceae bacterium]